MDEVTGKLDVVAGTSTWAVGSPLMGNCLS